LAEKLVDPAVGYYIFRFQIVFNPPLSDLLETTLA
jgi:hypothetical protein